MPEIPTLNEIQESTGIEKFLEDYYSDKNKEKLTAFLKFQQITTDNYVERDIALLLNALVTGSCMLEMTHEARLNLERTNRKYFELFKGSWSKRLDIIMEDETFLRWLLLEEKIDSKSFKERLLHKKEELDAEISKLDKKYGRQRAGNIKGIKEYFRQIVRQLDNMEFGQAQHLNFIYELLVAFGFEWNRKEKISAMKPERAKDNIRVSILQPIITDSRKEFALVIAPD